MPGRIQKHTLVHTVVIASLLTVFFDLSRIASLGAIVYLVMDVAVHWGVFRHLRREVQTNAAVLLGAIALDAAVLGAVLVMNAQPAPLSSSFRVSGSDRSLSSKRCSCDHAWRPARRTAGMDRRQ